MRALVLAILLAAGPALAQEPAPVGFTAAQADKGLGLYGDNCGACHGSILEGSEFAPALKSGRFRKTHGAQTAGELLGYVTANMPPGAAGSLEPDEYAAILAYVMKQNGAAEGAAFPADPNSKAPLGFPKAP
jgi:mono/diheme cytochrome c family protein